MIGTINSLVSKVVGTVSPYIVGEKAVKAPRTARAAKTDRKASRKCKTKSCRKSCKKCR